MAIFSAADFNSDVIPLNFNTSVTSLPCPITLVDDSMVENPEAFQLSLSLVNATDGSLSTSAAQPSVATVIITDDGKH